MSSDMDRVTHHEIESPCEWCGATIRQPARGRRRYCNRSHQQRAYEVRAAERRLQHDIAAQRIAVEPAERVVEKTIQPRYPRTPSGWLDALAELERQMAAGAFAPDSQWRLERELARLITPAPRTTAPPAPATPPPPAPAPAAPVRQLAPVTSVIRPRTAPEHGTAGVDLSRLLAATHSRRVTLTGLADELLVPVSSLRAALAAAVRAGRAEVLREGRPVDVNDLDDAVRFRLQPGPQRF